jgi:hypothetical protein
VRQPGWRLGRGERLAEFVQGHFESKRSQSAANAAIRTSGVDVAYLRSISAAH